MMLAEQGRVSLHEPVSKYLPEFIGTIVGVECSGDSEGKPTLKQVPAERPMTIQDLLRHTAGLTYGLFGSSLVKTSYDEAGVFDLRNTNAEMSQKLATLPLAHQPGQVSVGFEAEAPMRDIGQSFGLGFAIRTRDGLNSHPGSVGDYYWAGALGTYFWVDPAKDLIAIFMSQVPGLRLHYRNLMRQLVYPALL
jgi:CubicO group peptidase (beta-lactamase class C family)